MRPLAIIALCLGLGACGEPAPTPFPPLEGAPVAMAYARTFRVVARDGYKVVDLKASIVAWGGAAEGPEQHARLVLVPAGVAAPPLTGDLDGATLIRTPVQRIAANYAPFEAMLIALGQERRLVAVGGTKSYNDGIRARVLAGEVAQIGYGWHAPPNLDALIAAKPDVFLMSMGDLSHTRHMDRIRAMGIAVVPSFLDSETTYMGKVDYIRLVGMLTGREQEAEDYVADVATRVDALKVAAAAQPRKKVITAWYAGGDVWMATIRNADAQLLRDANGINLLEEPDDSRRDAFARLGTEVVLQRGRDADCFILRDTVSEPFTNTGILRQFEAWRNDCLFAADGMSKPEVDAYDIYETGVIRPDLILGDIARMLHPALRTEPFVYIRPDAQVR